MYEALADFRGPGFFITFFYVPFRAFIQSFTIGLLFSVIKLSVAPWTVDNTFKYAFTCLIPLAVVKVLTSLIWKISGLCIP
jgi:hypothetical protein